ncbi:MAG: SPW repeat protein [Pseudolabrys sp.]|nr:SPW repeat protein [Pseudolabrys sp.]
MIVKNWKKETIGDAVNVLLGAFLFLSPWIFGFSSEPAASWNAWLSGIVIVALAAAALAAFAELEEWLNLIAGVWVALSPWLVGFWTDVAAMWLHIVIGVIVAVIAAARLWFLHHHTPRVTA